jgi:membrane associated rhomboid family serine protease
MVFGGLELLLGPDRRAASGVAHFAHLGGMLGGFLMIRYWRGQMPRPFGSSSSSSGSVAAQPRRV